jgi:hypothetical protein
MDAAGVVQGGEMVPECRKRRGRIGRDWRSRRGFASGLDAVSARKLKTEGISHKYCDKPIDDQNLQTN